MRILNLAYLLFSFYVCLSAADLPIDSSKTLIRAEARYQANVAEVISDLSADLKKQLQRHVKDYAKVEKSVKKNGDLNGLKVLAERLKKLNGTKRVDLFAAKASSDPEDEKTVALEDLPSEAQRLELSYEQEISEIIQEHIEDLNEAIDDWRKSLVQERRKCINKDALDQAEHIQKIIDTVSFDQHKQQLSEAIASARLLSSPDIDQLQASQAWIAGCTVTNYVVFSWFNSKMQNMVFDLKGRPMVRCDLSVRDQAAFDEAGHMNTEKGSFVSSVNGVAIVKACRKTNQLSIEANIQTHDRGQYGPARIISFSLDGDERNFTIGQQGNDLILRLRTNLTDTNGTNPEIELGEFPPNGRVHLIVSYYPGKLVWWINGEEQSSTEIKGDFSTWNSSHTLLFGDEMNDSRHWSGRLWAVRIRSAAVNEEMAQRAFVHAQKTWASAVAVPLEVHEHDEDRHDDDEAVRD
jgi:hypothetical protein